MPHTINSQGMYVTTPYGLYPVVKTSSNQSQNNLLIYVPLVYNTGASLLPRKRSSSLSKLKPKKTGKTVIKATKSKKK